MTETADSWGELKIKDENGTQLFFKTEFNGELCNIVENALFKIENGQMNPLNDPLIYYNATSAKVFVSLNTEADHENVLIAARTRGLVYAFYNIQFYVINTLACQVSTIIPGFQIKK